ncbi:MAG: hypothetical protein Q8P18_33150 [Pseudomonadota bacterium]|nr:hypothetical protein [Pseudomonadota bacterium]
MNDSLVRIGFCAAAAFNIAGMLVFTRLFTNEVLFATDPGLFSQQGCILVIIWGLAYLAQAASWRAAPWISAVFAVEKVFFAGSWLLWMSREAHRLPEISAADPLAGAFYGLYGVGDGLFAGFFAWAFIKARAKK